MSTHPLRLRRGVGLLLLGLACLALAACRDDDDDAPPPSPTDTPIAATQAPRPPFQSPTPGGILAPVQTAQATPADLTRDRAEAFLRRVAITDADVPATLREEQSGLIDNLAAAQTEVDPDAGKTRYDRQGRILGFGRVFAVPTGATPPAGGPGVLQIRQAVALYNSSAGAAEALAHLATLEKTDPSALKRIIEPQSLEGLITNATFSTLPQPRIGDQAQAWEIAGPLRTSPGASAAITVVAVQRGPTLSYVTAYGAGDESRRAALDLATRLDTRTTEALRTGP